MIHPTLVLSCLVLALSGFAGCSRQPAAHNADPAAPVGQRPTAAATVPAAQSGSPSAAGTIETVTGTVAETMDASNYTYVRVKTGSREIWAASSRFRVKVGDKVTVPLESPMENFHSKTLNRDFPLIYFASGITREGDPAPMAMVPAHGGAGGSVQAHQAPQTSEAPQASSPIAPAPGGMRIADVWAKRKSLAGQKVTVRGRVVKFNGEIMGRNWIHIQDGSGKASDGTNDLPITTDGVAKVGDVITATGTVGVDRDFTAGYKYPVIIEKATIAQVPASQSSQ